MQAARYNYRRWISYERRHAIYLRDGYTCQYCGADLLDINPFYRTLDHVVARREGGASEPANLVTACRSCNCSKQAKPLNEWRPEAIDAILVALAQPLDVAYARRYLKARRAQKTT
jgi:hypothetical protein